VELVAVAMGPVNRRGDNDGLQYAQFSIKNVNNTANDNVTETIPEVIPAQDDTTTTSICIHCEDPMTHDMLNCQDFPPESHAQPLQGRKLFSSYIIRVNRRFI